MATADREAIGAAFARYDAVARRGAVASVLGAGLFLVTAVLLLAGGDPVGPNLSLLGQFLFGFIVARCINAVVALQERRFLLQADFTRSLP